MPSYGNGCSQLESLVSYTLLLLIFCVVVRWERNSPWRYASMHGRSEETFLHCMPLINSVLIATWRYNSVCYMAKLLKILETHSCGKPYGQTIVSKTFPEKYLRVPIGSYLRHMDRSTCQTACSFSLLFLGFLDPLFSFSLDNKRHILWCGWARALLIWLLPVTWWSVDRLPKCD